ncbi:signal recognition particle protein Srp19, partial [Candidatus Pacearchaeota archaeon CG10_big_fil_rev_8_21_14_0_10_30_48]
MLESLGNILRKSVDKITSAIFVDKKLVDSIVKDLQRALISADVNISLVKELSEKIKSEGEKYVKDVEKKEHLIKLLNDEITEILGGEKKELKLEKQEKILFVG